MIIKTKYFTIRPELLIAALVSAALAVHVLEAALPMPGPWFKPGLANIFVLVAFFHLGWRKAALVALLRVVLGGLLLGTFLSPTFMLSLAGTLSALLALALVRWLPIGPVGASVLASLAHLSGQFIVAAWVLIGHMGLLSALPWFLAGAWITGLINGVIAFLILDRLSQWLPRPVEQPS
ncbi:MAG: Gx transporter family protein [Magnetococcales bacterium]|nr:Gx transporter family protein [Magnetococcales bacterium]